MTLNLSRWNLHFLFLLSVFFLLFVTCRKIDRSAELTVSEKEESDFFTKHVSPDPLIQSVMAFLKRQNEKFHFVETLVQKIGYPYWDKSLIVNNQGARLVQVKLSEDSTTLVYIPFVIDSTQSVKATLIAQLTPSDSVIRLIRDWHYSNFGFNQADSGRWNARDIFNIFTKFQKTIYGHKTFEILDNRLFGDVPDSTGKNIVTLKDNSQSQRTSILVPITECFETHYCWVPLGETDCTNNDCDVGCQFYQFTWDDCTTFMVDISVPGGDSPSPPPPPPSGGGGGGGSGGNNYWWLECLDDPTTPDNECGGTVGWTAVQTTDNLNLLISLQNNLNIGEIELTWLSQNLDAATSINESLNESLEDENPVTLIAYQNQFPDYALIASKISIAAAMNNLINGAYNGDHLELVKSFIPNSQNLIIDPIYWSLFTVQCIIIKAEHPTWSNLRVYWEATKEVVHMILDGIGLIPVVGEFADLANGIIYTIEGEGVNATLSFSAMIPFAGWGATTAKYAKKIVTSLDGSKRTLNWIKQTNNIIDFGDRGLLRKVLGLAKGDSRVAHHIIPWEKATHPAVQKAASGSNAFHLNEILNGIPLNQAVHSGNHTAYLARVQARLDAIPLNLSPDAIRAEIDILINDIKNAILNNSNTHIDNLIF